MDASAPAHGSKMDILILLGAPGSGKGTLAARLVEKVEGFSTVSTGDLLRSAVKEGTPAGLKAKPVMEQGGLVPDELIAEMIGDYLAQAPKSGVLALDGFPRTVRQADMLETILKENGARLLKAVQLDVPEPVIMERLGGRRVCPACKAGYHVTGLPPKTPGICDRCGATLVIRKDDNPETIANRLRVYAEQTAPLVDYYAQRGLLVTVPAAGPVDQTAETICRDILA